MTHKVRPKGGFQSGKVHLLSASSRPSETLVYPPPCIKTHCLKGIKRILTETLACDLKIFRLDFTQLTFKLTPPLQVCCSQRYRSKHTGAGRILSLTLAEVVTVTLSPSSVVGLPFIWIGLNLRECVQRKWRKVGNGLPLKPCNKIRYKSSYEG